MHCSRCVAAPFPPKEKGPLHLALAFYAILELMEVSILFEEGLEDSVDEGWLRGVVETTLRAEGLTDSADISADISAGTSVEVSLVIAGQDEVHRLNREYLGEDRPTDVLSFPMLPPHAGDDPSFVTPPDGLRHLGEVIVSYPQAVTQAQEHGHTPTREVAILIIHGVLHLLGYDHAEPAEEKAMRSREAAIMAQIEGGHA